MPIEYGVCRMQRYNKIIWVAIVAAVTLVMSGSAAGKVAVFVSIIPQKYFVQKIGKNLVDVQVMVANIYWRALGEIVIFILYNYQNSHYMKLRLGTHFVNEQQRFGTWKINSNYV